MTLQFIHAYAIELEGSASSKTNVKFDTPQLHQKTKGVTGHPVTPLCVGRPRAGAAAPSVTWAGG